MKNQMTIKEAISNGYTFCGKEKQEWQHLTPVMDLNEIDIAEDELYLAEKKGNSYSFSKDEIADLLADVISSNESEDSRRDDDDVFNAIKLIDFSYTEKQIQDVLDGFLRYKLTNIKLVAEKIKEKAVTE